MALGAFVTDAKCTTCSRRFSIRRTVLRMLDLLRLKSSSRSTHVLMKTGYLFGASASSAARHGDRILQGWSLSLRRVVRLWPS